MHENTEPARKVLGAAKMVLALLAALAIAISTISWIDPAPAHAQETEATSEESAADAPSDATRDAAEQAVADEVEDQPSAQPEAPAEADEPVESETPEVVTSESEEPTEDPEPKKEEESEEEESEEDAFSVEIDGPYSNEIMVQLAGQNRRRSARAVNPSIDPRYTCGASIALIMDNSSSTEPYKENAKAAAYRAIDNLVGTGSQLGIISFNATARQNLAKTELTPSNVAQAKNAVSNMQWVKSTEPNNDGSNIAGALELASRGGYDAVIIVTDGLANSSTSDPQVGRYGFTTDRDLLNVTEQAAKLKNAGTAIFGIGVVGREEVAVLNLVNRPTFAPWINWWYADSDPIPSYLRKSTQNEKLQTDFESRDGYYPSWMWHNQAERKLETIGLSTRIGPDEKTGKGRAVYRAVTGIYMGPLYTMRALNGPKFVQSWADSYDTTTSDLSNLESKIDALTSGCWGTVNLQKEIVDSTGKVQSGKSVNGFEFVADKALNGPNVQNNYTIATDDQGKATFHYPTDSGVGSMTLKETQRDGYKLYEQSVNGQKTLAKCTAKSKNGSDVPVSYGSGSGIVVTSKKEENSFSLSGVGTQHRVTCTVQNYEGKPDFTLTKKPFGDAVPRVITGEANQTFKVEYLVSAENKGTGAGKVPAIIEKPAAPNGMSVTNVEALPDGQNPLVQSGTQLAKTGDSWKLDPAKTNDVNVNETRTAKIVVTYRVNQPGSVNKDQLTCESGNNSKGLFNHVEFEGAKEAKQQSDACVSATVPGVELKKLINNADANTKEEATSIMGGTNQVTIEYQVKNTGTTPLTEIRLDDYNLDKDSGAKQGPINMTGLTCEGASVRDDNQTKVITPNKPLAKDQTLKCRWNAQAPIVPDEGEYHGDRGIILASYALPEGQGGTVKPVSAENDAWVFKLPVAVGVLPDAGAKGPTQYLILGGLIAMAGAFWAYRRRA
ncbi:vWA domain-containing protein [Corynebacterium pseudopelargi]|uniref:vWA domain-containing protein n=1 Tax=Corynebacterium pseudopelargi TaxID=2080757 RepID=UPI000F50268D|nr:vWA domain-containing protein [Corynebacterium pseudopelargi]